MKTILIVDDNEVDTFINRKILERAKPPREIHTASNGSEAVKLLNEYHQRLKELPHVILLDLNMPIMDGFEFIENFKKLPLSGKENVTIIIVTSSQNPKEIEKAKANGVEFFLVKPLTEEKLFAALDAVDH